MTAIYHCGKCLLQWPANPDASKAPTPCPNCYPVPLGDVSLKRTGEPHTYNELRKIATDHRGNFLVNRGRIAAAEAALDHFEDLVDASNNDDDDWVIVQINRVRKALKKPAKDFA